MARPSLKIFTVAVGFVCASVGVSAFAAEGHVRPIEAHEHAQTHWEKTHPWRDQVNDRLQRQRRRIRKEVREGELTPAQAEALHQQDVQIRAEERAWAANQGGHITKAQQAQLNAQENQISQSIGH